MMRRRAGRPLLSRGSSAVAMLAAALFLAAPACGREPLPVMTTTTDLRSLVEAVGGELVAAQNLVPPERDPEEYQPKPQDVARLARAALVVRVGLDFDLWLDRLLAQAATPAIRRGAPGYVDASFGIAALEVRGVTVGPGDGHAHGSGNPHYWLDPKNANIITGNILEGLVRIDPDNAGTYERNRQAFLERLDRKLPEWEAKLAGFRAVPLVAQHNSFAYFARRFRLDFIGFIEPKPGVPPNPKHLASLIGTMRARNVRLIVRQPHDPAKASAFLAQKTGARTIVLAGSVEALPEARDYLSLFDANIEALLRARE